MKLRSSDTVYGIGIDTGGTYTDAVLFDLREHQVIWASLPRDPSVIIDRNFLLWLQSMGILGRLTRPFSLRRNLLAIPSKDIMRVVKYK